VRFGHSVNVVVAGADDDDDDDVAGQFV